MAVTAQGSLLLVDDDVGFVRAAAEVARLEGFDTTVADGVAQARARLKNQHFDLVLIDLNLPDGSGLDILQDINLAGRAVVALVTGHPTVESAVRAFRLPISDYLIKPIEIPQFKSLLSRAAEQRRLPPPTLEDGWLGLVGKSAALRRVKQEIQRVGPTEASVLIQGESGVGKELVARAIHTVSGRSGEFVALNCGAVPAEILASQLFGHEKGSFTGAIGRHAGLFEQAHGGTLFLDEVTEMPLHLQAHLLRALDSGRFRRVGGSEDIKVDVRIVAATNRPPDKAIRSGMLREDLFYRLSEFPITVSPLRERPEDLQALADHFLACLNQRGGTNYSYAPQVAEQLRRYSWPGNVRELRNAVQRAYILAENGVVSLPRPRAHLAPLEESASSITFAVGMPLEQIERQVLMKTLAYFDNNKVKAAEALGITAKTIYNRLARYEQQDRSGEGESRAAG